MAILGTVSWKHTHHPHDDQVGPGSILLAVLALTLALTAHFLS